MATQLIKNIARQQQTLLPRICQRSFHTSLTTLSETTVSTPRKKREHREPTRFVQIEYLPTTATSEDIRKLAREAFNKGDHNITEMVFCRNFGFNFNGRCVVSMANADDARRLVEYANRRLVGGKVIDVRYVGKAGSDNNTVMSKYRPAEMMSITDTTSAAGRSVIVTGFPPRTRPEHVNGYLRSKNFFPVEGSNHSVIRLKTKEQATVSKFLIKFDSESEAWRCVRAFHNSNYFFQQTQENFKLRLNVAY